MFHTAHFHIWKFTRPRFLVSDTPFKLTPMTSSKKTKPPIILYYPQKFFIPPFKLIILGEHPPSKDLVCGLVLVGSTCMQTTWRRRKLYCLCSTRPIAEPVVYVFQRPLLYTALWNWAVCDVLSHSILIRHGRWEHFSLGRDWNEGKKMEMSACEGGVSGSVRDTVSETSWLGLAMSKRGP